MPYVYILFTFLGTTYTQSKQNMYSPLRASSQAQGKIQFVWVVVIFLFVIGGIK